MKIPIIIVKLLFLGALVIISNHNLHLSDQTQREAFVGFYSEWLGNLFTQGAEVTSYVIKFEWLPSVEAISLNSQIILYS